MRKRAQKMLRCSALTGLILAATLLISGLEEESLNRLEAAAQETT